MQKRLLAIGAVLGTVLFWCWAGATFLLDMAGRAQTLEYVAKHHHDFAKWLVSTPPAFPGVAGLLLALLLCWLLLKEPLASPSLATVATAIVLPPTPPAVSASKLRQAIRHWL